MFEVLNKKESFISIDYHITSYQKISNDLSNIQTIFDFWIDICKAQSCWDWNISWDLKVKADVLFAVHGSMLACQAMGTKSVHMSIMLLNQSWTCVLCYNSGISKTEFHFTKFSATGYFGKISSYLSKLWSVWKVENLGSVFQVALDF